MTSLRSATQPRPLPGSNSIAEPSSFGPPLIRLPWWLPVGMLIAAVLVMPFDGAICGWWSSLALPSDVDQELRFLQQFGQFGSLVLITVVVCSVSRPAIRRTLLDLGLAVLVTVLLGLLAKVLVGRLRPAFGTPSDVLGPWWMQVGNDTTWSQRGSTPSTHTAAAAVLATWMWLVFPRLRWLGVAFTLAVAAARVRFEAHWPSDVMLGATAGVVGGTVVAGRLWATRLLDVAWRRLVDRNASPAWPEVRAAVEQQRASRASGSDAD